MHGEVSALSKRSATYGPFWHIPGLAGLCPTSSDATGGTTCDLIKAYDDNQLNDPNFNGVLRRRSSNDIIDDVLFNKTGYPHMLEKRAGGTEFYEFCKGDAKMQYQTPSYPSGTVNYDCDDWTTCSNFGLGIHPHALTHNYIDEHILERQMIQPFAARYLENKDNPNGEEGTYCKYIQNFWTGQKGRINGVWAWDTVASAFPSNAAHGNEIVQTDSEINQAKARAFKSGVAINDVDKLIKSLKTPDGANKVFKAVKDAVLAVKYMNEATVNGYYLAQGKRVAAQFVVAEKALKANWAGTDTPYTIQGLDQDWLQFMRDYTNEVKGKFEAYLNLWSGSLARDWVPAGQAADPSLQELADKINALVTEVNTVTGGGMFTNPF